MEGQPGQGMCQVLSSPAPWNEDSKVAAADEGGGKGRGGWKFLPWTSEEVAAVHHGSVEDTRVYPNEKVDRKNFSERIAAANLVRQRLKDIEGTNCDYMKDSSLLQDPGELQLYHRQLCDTIMNLSNQTHVQDTMQRVEGFTVKIAQEVELLKQLVEEKPQSKDVLQLWSIRRGGGDGEAVEVSGSGPMVVRDKVPHGCQNDLGAETPHLGLAGNLDKEVCQLDGTLELEAEKLRGGLHLKNGQS